MCGKSSHERKMKKIAFVVSSPMTLKAFFIPHLELLQHDFSVNVIANTHDTGMLRQLGIPLDIDHAPIERSIRPLKDLIALAHLYKIFRERKFDAVYSVTPKAGLLAMMAAKLTGTPIRIHTFTGQVWATQSGLPRFVLKCIDGITARFATHVLTDSESQRQFLISEHVISEKHSQVLADGSISGVNLKRFKPDPQVRKEIRNHLGVPNAAILLLFLGRLNRDKGVLDLAKAFLPLATENLQIHLAFVGPDEDDLRPAILQICSSYADQVHFVNYTDTPECYMAAADVFCLPSYREGFGSVVIEAAAVGVPSVASRIYGLTDSVQEGLTGLLHEPGNIQSIYSCLKELVEFPDKRLAMGKAAEQRAIKDFSSQRVTTAFLEFLRCAIKRHEKTI